MAAANLSSPSSSSSHRLHPCSIPLVLFLFDFHIEISTSSYSVTFLGLELGLPVSVQTYQDFPIKALRSNAELITYGDQHDGNFFEVGGSRILETQASDFDTQGPWFRMCNISYAEILDHQQPVKELSSGGYVYSIETINELHKDDLEGILNVLNAGELREMLSVINKLIVKETGLGESRVIHTCFFSS
ncbi:hypothetical protein L2E82_46820 [Cichorium intybus]|uniref:Uncharacterized protein n=1 Tax=Cichorium intybus TaxID=13427 RepID=A0ACB8YTW8_CICIN|nr:hypothetical protein L2E82_46820 [Cichorium intybus]